MTDQSQAVLPAIEIHDLHKTFTVHSQGGVELPVLKGIDCAVYPGECVILRGPSGAGKSTLLKCIYGNYLAQSGSIVIRHNGVEVDIATASPREILRLRRDTLGYVTQFLRVVPRVSVKDVVGEPLRVLGQTRDEAQRQTEKILRRLQIPRRLWELAPATFSGGEQQRVNIARGFIVDYPVLLLDEPTAALDPRNRDTVVHMIRDATSRGSAIIGIFHDEDVCDAVATRIVQIDPMEHAE